MTQPSEKNRRIKEVFAYFITIRTYATWLHGDTRGSVDSKHNIFNTPTRIPSHKLNQKMQQTANQTTFLLDQKMRKTVLRSMIQTCQCLRWKIFVVHVRSNHVHIVLQSHASKEEAMGKLKHYATRSLKKHYPELLSRHKFWSRHGSTKNIWAPEDIFPVLHYVIKRQGQPMALYYNESYYDALDEAFYECYIE